MNGLLSKNVRMERLVFKDEMPIIMLAYDKPCEKVDGYCQKSDGETQLVLYPMNSFLLKDLIATVIHEVSHAMEMTDEGRNMSPLLFDEILSKSMSMDLFKKGHSYTWAQIHRGLIVFF